MGGDEQVDIEQLKKMNPWITGDIKVMMGRFYKEGIKSEFEKAEKGNITSFFEKTYDSGWTDCIIAHRNGCIGCSIFNNYDDWIKENHPEATHNLFYPWKSQSEKEWIK